MGGNGMLGGTGTGESGIDGSENVSRFLAGDEGVVPGVVPARVPWFGLVRPGRAAARCCFEG